MQRLAVVFLTLALLATPFGYGVAEQSWEGARIFFIMFFGLAVLSFLGGTRGKVCGSTLLVAPPREQPPVKKAIG